MVETLTTWTVFRKNIFIMKHNFVSLYIENHIYGIEFSWIDIGVNIVTAIEWENSRYFKLRSFSPRLVLRRARSILLAIGISFITVWMTFAEDVFWIDCLLTSLWKSSSVSLFFMVSLISFFKSLEQHLATAFLAAELLFANQFNAVSYLDFLSRAITLSLKDVLWDVLRDSKMITYNYWLHLRCLKMVITYVG